VRFPLRFVVLSGVMAGAWAALAPVWPALTTATAATVAWVSRVCGLSAVAQPGAHEENATAMTASQASSLNRGLLAIHVAIPAIVWHHWVRQTKSEGSANSCLMRQRRPL
jgi:hypothetical protein